MPSFIQIQSKCNAFSSYWSEMVFGFKVTVTLTFNLMTPKLTLKVLNFWKFTSYCSLKPLWSGMGEVVPARTSPTLHPPFPPTVHQLSQLELSELIGVVHLSLATYPPIVRPIGPWTSSYWLEIVRSTDRPKCNAISLPPRVRHYKKRLFLICPIFFHVLSFEPKGEKRMTVTLLKSFLIENIKFYTVCITVSIAMYVDDVSSSSVSSACAAVASWGFILQLLKPASVQRRAWAGSSGSSAGRQRRLKHDKGTLY